MLFRSALAFTTIAVPLTSITAWASDPASVGERTLTSVRLGTGAAEASPVEITLPEVDVVSQQLDQARSQLQPSLGATVYDFSRSAIEALPQGDDAPLNHSVAGIAGVSAEVG